MIGPEGRGQVNAILTEAGTLNKTWNDLYQWKSPELLFSLYSEFDTAAKPVDSPILKGAKILLGSDNNEEKEAAKTVISRYLIGRSLRTTNRLLRRLSHRNDDRDGLVQDILLRMWGRINNQRPSIYSYDKNPTIEVNFSSLDLGVVDVLYPDPEQIIIERDDRNILLQKVPDLDTVDPDKEFSSALVQEIRDLLTLTPLQVDLKKRSADLARLVESRKMRTAFQASITSLRNSGRFYSRLQEWSVALKTEPGKGSKAPFPKGVTREFIYQMIADYRVSDPEPVFQLFDEGRNFRAEGIDIALLFLTRDIVPFQRYQIGFEFYNSIRNDGEGGSTFILPKVGGIHFSAERMLLACATATDDTDIFYPITDGDNRVISNIILSTTPAQRYFLERKARQILADQGKLPFLYRGHTDRHIVNQQRNGKVTFNPYGNSTSEYEDGVLFFPVGNSEVLHLTISEKGREDREAANYSNRFGNYTLIESYLRRVVNSSSGVIERGSVRNIALHERSHHFWSKLSRAQTKEILDIFDLNTPHFIAFGSSLASRKLYRDIATEDLQLNPSLEPLELKIGSELVRLSKRVIVNELLAYATAEPNTAQQLKDKVLSSLDRQAWACIASLPSVELNKIMNYGLVIDSSSENFEMFFQAFEQAITILVPDYNPKIAATRFPQETAKEEKPTDSKPKEQPVSRNRQSLWLAYLSRMAYIIRSLLR